MVVLAALAVVLYVARPWERGGGGRAPMSPGDLQVKFRELTYNINTPESMDRAEQMLRAALKTHPRKDQVYTLLGLLEMERARRASNTVGGMGASPRAAKMFNRALSIDPKNLAALRGLASYHEYRGAPREALVVDERIIAAAPGDAAARTHKGRCLLLLNQPVRAEKLLKEAQKLARQAGDAKVEVEASEILGQVYTRQRRYALAEKTLEAAVKRAEAKNVAACPYAALGELYRLTGRKKKLAEMHARAADMESRKPRMQFYAARIFHRQGDHERALVYIKRALALHDAPEYRKLHQSIVADMKPRPPAEETQAALAAFSRGNFHKAQNHANRAVAGGGRGRPEVIRGFILLLEKRYQEAEKQFARAGEDPGAVVGRGHISIIRKKYRAARALLVPAVKAGTAGPKDGYSWLCFRMACLGMGWVSANTGKHEEAVAHFDRVLAHHKDDTFALLGKGNSLNALGKLDRAEKHLERVLALDRTNRFALAELALVKYNRGQDQESERLFRAAMKGDPRQYTCPHEGLGMIYLRAGKLKQARESFSKAIKINPDIEFKKYNGLARIFIREGKYGRARKLLRKSMENYAHDGEARKLLASIKGKEDAP